MAVVEDVLKGNLVVAVAVGGAALLWPRLAPHLSPSARGMVRSGLKLFVESESEAEGGIIGRFADTALEQVLDRLNGPGAPKERRDAANAVITDFKRRARARARQYGADEADRHDRYDRHLAALEQRLGRARGQQKGDTGAVLRDLSSTLKRSEEDGDGVV